MIARAAYVAAMLLAAPAGAQDLDVIGGCAAAPIGAPTCDGEALAENLGLLGAGDVKVFSSYGVESFALLTALRHGASAIFLAAEGEGCFAEEERTAALEIWSIWVSPPREAPRLVSERYAMFEDVMDNIVALEVTC
ncbi:hypothetical protein [Oceanibium sediminis]|uniref:hypothetical protein n=1 Tax=Oceanibium sediminis TaxID=2026339 RepID=UPI0013001E80|nr:hypothetical protein [Oceanibium sediminis]